MSNTLTAAIYDPFLAFGERRGMRERRGRLLRKARGRVLEVGAGTGLNLAHYPDGLEELMLSEPANPMARRLESRLRRSGLTASVLRADAEELPLESDSVDTVVSTLVLCTVPDPAAALDEIRRVLRPGGRLLFCEHVRSDSHRLQRWQERLARPWRAFADGCRCNQETVGLIESALHIERLEREEWRGMPGLVRPLVIGEASARWATPTTRSWWAHAAPAPRPRCCSPARATGVLVVDQATFPSDTISTHLIHPPGVSALRDWGLLDRLLATGCPAIHTYAYDFGHGTIAGSPGTDESPRAYAPRRTVLDKLLVDAAAEAGAEVREGFTVTDLLVEEGRVAGVRGHRKGEAPVTERARVVIGADGHHSLVARSVNAQRYNEKPALQVSYYAYVSDLPMDGRFEVYLRPGRGFAAWPTNDDLAVVIGGWPRSELIANREDIEGNFLATLDLVPEFAARFRAARRETRFVGMSLANFLRKPFGPGWALVGDAGYTKDFITGLGISDAFRDASLCAAALDAAGSGTRPFADAMAAYQAERDRSSLPFYEFTAQLAALEPLPPELERILDAVQGDQAEMDAFARVGGAVLSPAEFLSEENVGRLLAA